MRINNKIKTLIDKLLATHLTIGVQPSELAEAIFEPSYRDLEVVNKNGTVQMVVSFNDTDDDGESVIVKMHYIYNLNKQLMRIEQKVGNQQFKVQWDREHSVANLIDELELHLSALNNMEDAKRVIATVPQEFKSSIMERLKLAV